MTRLGPPLSLKLETTVSYFATVRLESSPDLTHWFPMATISENSFSISQTVTPAGGLQYYRYRTVPPSP